MDIRSREEQTRRSNLRTGLVLGSIAIAFFIGVIIKFMLL